MSDWPFLMEFARARRGQPLALATLVGREGSSYRPPGARMLIDRHSHHAGTLSGGCLENGIAAVGRRVIARGLAEDLEIDTRPHFGCPGMLAIHIERLRHEEDGLLERIDRNMRLRREFRLSTGGEMTRILTQTASSGSRLVENVGLRPRLVMIGDTSDGEPLLRLAGELGWELHRVSPEGRSAGPATPVVAGEQLAVCRAEEMADRFSPDAATAMLVMTHHLATDLHYLKHLLPNPYPYIGLLGSRRRRETLLAEAGESGLLDDPSLEKRLFAPVGLDLGGGHPAIIALAVVAEIQAAFAGTSGGFLRDRLGTIHRRDGAWA